MLPTALRVTSVLTFVALVAGTVVVAAALKDGGASQGAVTGAYVGGCIQAFVTAWLLFAAGEWLETRACPRCGKRVPAGVTVCQSCDFDFHSVAP